MGGCVIGACHKVRAVGGFYGDICSSGVCVGVGVGVGVDGMFATQTTT
jgi:hypothetical protein